VRRILSTSLPSDLISLGGTIYVHAMHLVRCTGCCRRRDPPELTTTASCTSRAHTPCPETKRIKKDVADNGIMIFSEIDQSVRDRDSALKAKVLGPGVTTVKCPIVFIERASRQSL